MSRNPKPQSANAPTQEEVGKLLSCYNAGDLEAAERIATAMTRKFPKFAFAWTILGAIAKQAGRLQDSLVPMQHAARLAPNAASAHHNLGVTLKALGHFADAERSFREALRLNPSDANTHYSLSFVLKGLGRMPEAESSIREAIRLKPDFAEAHNDLGVILHELGRFAEAEASCRTAIRVKPDYASAHSNLGATLGDLGRAVEGQISHREALRLDPNSAQQCNNLGLALVAVGELAEAEELFRRALAIDPNYTTAFDNLLFTMNYHPDKTAEEVRRVYAEYDRRFGAPHAAAIRPHANAPAAGRRLKIGYVSPDFRRHSVRYFLEPLLARHDRTAFELHAYAEFRAADDWTARYKTYFDHWTATYGIGDDALAEKIRSDGIDILVDLAGHTANTRLSVFFRKPAPVSVSWLGYAYTTGLAAIDYFLTDEACAPPGSDHLFAETPWRIETPSFVYRPNENMGPVGELPALAKGCVTFGTLTRAARINRYSVELWSQILLAVPNSRLVIDSFSFSDRSICEKLASQFAAFGVARERLEIGHRSPPWDVLRSIDICFDCFPHNSGVTLFECLYMGLPCVTLAGRPSVGRIGSSVLHGVGHPEWIAHTPEAYRQIAVDLASDLPKLAAIRSTLRAEMQGRPIMDEGGFAKRVEAAYRQMFEKWQARNNAGSA